jgi:sulfur relay protein TusB/DsrH
MILHCLNCDAYAPAVDDLLAVASADDAILLLGEACNLARPGHPRFEAVRACGARLHALQADLALHGVSPANDVIHRVDFAAWVELAALSDAQLCWR